MPFDIVAVVIQFIRVNTINADKIRAHRSYYLYVSRCCLFLLVSLHFSFVLCSDVAFRLHCKIWILTDDILYNRLTVAEKKVKRIWVSKWRCKKKKQPCHRKRTITYRRVIGRFISFYFRRRRSSRHRKTLLTSGYEEYKWLKFICNILIRMSCMTGRAPNSHRIVYTQLNGATNLLTFATEKKRESPFYSHTVSFCVFFFCILFIFIQAGGLREKKAKQKVNRS